MGNKAANNSITMLGDQLRAPLPRQKLLYAGRDQGGLLRPHGHRLLGHRMFVLPPRRRQGLINFFDSHIKSKNPQALNAPAG
jgi:hypothetical protein